MLRDIHARAIQMWAGCIWVPIYEVMTRKHLTIVTLEENLELAADIGLEATTSIEGALTAALERHGSDAKVVVLPYARYQLPRNAVMDHADRHVFAYAGQTRSWRIRRAARFHRASGAGPRRRRSRDPRLDDDPRAPADVPRRPRGEADGRDPVPVPTAAGPCASRSRLRRRATRVTRGRCSTRSGRSRATAEREQLERARERRARRTAR